MKRDTESMTADELRELIRADALDDGAPSDDAIAASERLAELERSDIPAYADLAPATTAIAHSRRLRVMIRVSVVAAAVIALLVVATTAGLFRNELKEDWEARTFDVTVTQMYATYAVDIDTNDELWIEQRYTVDGPYGRLIHLEQSEFTPNGEPHVWFYPPKLTESGLGIISVGRHVITYGDSMYGVEEGASECYIGEPYSEEAVAAHSRRKSPHDLSDSKETLKLPIGTLDENGRYSLKIDGVGVNNDSTAYFNIFKYDPQSPLDLGEWCIDSSEPWLPITFLAPEKGKEDPNLVYSAVCYFNGRRLLLKSNAPGANKPLAEILADDGVNISVPTALPEEWTETQASKTMAPDRVLYHTEWQESSAFSIALRMDVAQYFDPDSRISLESAVTEQLESAEKYELDGITYYYLPDEVGGTYRIVWQTADCDCRISGRIYRNDVTAIIASMHDADA